MNQIPLSRCEWDKNSKVLKIASEYMGMPHEFSVKSEKTGKVVRFRAITSDDVMSDPDQWDGEQMIYRPVGIVPMVSYAVIYNQW